jgi:NAD(P)-dependent dehydrogenase (short-subunit alcohol dehydrogenase family)
MPSVNLVTGASAGIGRALTEQVIAVDGGFTTVRTRVKWHWNGCETAPWVEEPPHGAAAGRRLVLPGASG